MPRQSHLRLHFIFLALLLMGGSWGCARGPAEQGLVFEQRVLDLGERWAGEIIPLEFPFEVVGSEVRIDSALPDCGCLSPELRVGGKKIPLGSVLAPGTKGVLSVAYHTAGFQGRKFTGVDLEGEGIGLPGKVEIQSWLRPWFEITPRAVDFGAVSGEEALAVEVTIRGQKPFRIESILAQAPPAKIRGVPSASAALEQTLLVVLPETTAEGNHFGMFNFGTDQEGYTFNLPLQYRVAGKLWTLPDTKLLLGELRPGVEFFAQVEVGAREGALKAPEVELSGIPGGTVRVETLVEGARYRVQLGLTPEDGHVAGEMLLRLPYSDADGHSEVVERRIRVFGAVLKGKN